MSASEPTAMDISSETDTREAAPDYNVLFLLIRIFAVSIVAVMLVFLLNNYLNFWQDWPGLPAFFSHLGWFGQELSGTPLENSQYVKGWVQLLSYLCVIVLVVFYVLRTRQRSLKEEADLLSGFSAYLIRAAFWAVLIIGLVDIAISFLRVEKLLTPLVGETLAQSLGRAQFRGIYVHYPLILVSFVIAFFNRSLGFTWLTFLVVLAEFQIVISRFVFSYEQPFMGDLVRFWYAALFLFASAYTLAHEGHVRVDVFYSRFNHRGKAWSNTIGSLILGLPLGWVILVTGMWDKTSCINSPLRTFEISQSAYGLYVKWLMVAFLAVYAVSMIVQFSSYLLDKVADLGKKPGEEKLVSEP